MITHKYTKEEDIFLINNVKGITLKELTNRFNEKFNLNLSESAIGNRKHKLGLKSGIVGGQFQKGSIPMNKGKKWDEYMSKEAQEKARKTCFSSTDRSINNANYNYKPMYSERVGKDGYILIKANKHGNYVLKHKWIYEKYHNCKIPKGYVCIFLDGNKLNFDINNLAIVSKNENLILNRNKLRFEAVEATESGIKVAQLIETISKKKRGKQKC